MRRIRNVIEMCTELRNVRGLEPRTIFEFGAFLQDMFNYMMFDMRSNDRYLRRFQAMLRKVEDRFGDLYDPFDIETYVRLFEFYCLWLYGYYLGIERRREEKLIRRIEELKEMLLQRIEVPEWFFEGLVGEES